MGPAAAVLTDKIVTKIITRQKKAGSGDCPSMRVPFPLTRTPDRLHYDFQKVLSTFVPGPHLHKNLLKAIIYDLISMTAMLISGVKAAWAREMA